MSSSSRSEPADLPDSDFRPPAALPSDSEDEEVPPLVDAVPRDPPAEEAAEPAAEPALTMADRQRLFHRGRELEAEDQPERALDKYVKSLRGVRPETAFPEMPACLRAVAEIHFKKEQYEQAIHFIQAEKLYYEAALLDTSVLQKILDQGARAEEGDDDRGLQTLRANEYESLARFCLEKKELRLALEYAAKAAKLREFALGEDHQETTRSLDFVTSIYADLGRQEYAESLEKFDTATRPRQPPASAPLAAPPGTGTPQAAETAEREVRISLALFAGLVFVACSVLTVVGCYSFCELADSALCADAAALVRRHVDWLRFLVHQWTS